APTGHADDLDRIGRETPAPRPDELVPEWDLEAWRRLVRPVEPPAAGSVLVVSGGDMVSSAPELARLTLNVAAVHHDRAAGGGTRLVYGGHTIGLALAQAVRALPDLATVLAWESCDHVGPVREGDTLRSRVTVERVRQLSSGWTVLDLRSEVTADGDGAGDLRPVLDWRFSALVG
ncbi:MAG: acyl dehydratase, partial [Nocardioides sp.]